MSKSKKILKMILEAIDDIDNIIKTNDIKITQALNDKLIKPAIKMHIIRIAEGFNKLKQNNEFDILSSFEKNDLRGIGGVRNFIAHDYDSVDDEIIENVVRFNLPKIKDIVKTLLKG